MEPSDKEKLESSDEENLKAKANLAGENLLVEAKSVLLIVLMSMLHIHCGDTGWELLAVAMFVYKCVFDHSMFIGNIYPESFHFINDEKILMPSPNSLCPTNCQSLNT